METIALFHVSEITFFVGERGKSNGYASVIGGAYTTLQADQHVVPLSWCSEPPVGQSLVRHFCTVNSQESCPFQEAVDL